MCDVWVRACVYIDNLSSPPLANGMAQIVARLVVTIISSVLVG